MEAAKANVAEQQSQDSRWEQLNELCKVFRGISAQAHLLDEKLGAADSYYEGAQFVLAIQTMAEHGHNLAEQAMPEPVEGEANNA